MVPFFLKENSKKFKYGLDLPLAAQTYPAWLKHDVNIFPDSEYNKFGSTKRDDVLEHKHNSCLEIDLRFR